jgi:hypothetical protein
LKVTGKGFISKELWLLINCLIYMFARWTPLYIFKSALKQMNRF